MSARIPKIIPDSLRSSEQFMSVKSKSRSGGGVALVCSPFKVAKSTLMPTAVERIEGEYLDTRTSTSHGFSILLSVNDGNSRVLRPDPLMLRQEGESLLGRVLVFGAKIPKIVGARIGDTDLPQGWSISELAENRQLVKFSIPVSFIAACKDSVDGLSMELDVGEEKPVKLTILVSRE